MVVHLSLWGSRRLRLRLGHFYSSIDVEEMMSVALCKCQSQMQTKWQHLWDTHGMTRKFVEIASHRSEKKPRKKLRDKLIFPSQGNPLGKINPVHCMLKVPEQSPIFYESVPLITMVDPIVKAETNKVSVFEHYCCSELIFIRAPMNGMTAPPLIKSNQAMEEMINIEFFDKDSQAFTWRRESSSPCSFRANSSPNNHVMIRQPKSLTQPRRKGAHQ